VQNRIKKAKEQKVQVVIITVSNLNLNNVLRAIKGQIRTPENITS